MDAAPGSPDGGDIPAQADAAQPAVHAELDRLLDEVAAALPGRTSAAGLGTEGWLRIDTITPPYDASLGVVRTCDWQGTLSDRVLDKLFPYRNNQRFWEDIGAFHFSIGLF